MDNLYLNFQDAYIDEVGSMIVSSNMCNGLFEIRNGKNKYLGSFLNKSTNIQYLHKTVYYDGNELLFIPSYGNEIDIYDRINNKIDIITSDYKILDLTTSIILNGKVIFIPRNLNFEVCIFDIKNRVYEKDTWWTNIIFQLKEKYPKASFFYATVYKDNIYLPLRGYNIILEINYYKKTFIKHLLNMKDSIPYSIDFFNDVAWITQENSKNVLIWNYKYNNFEIFEVDNGLVLENYIPYIKTVFLNNCAIFIPRNHPIVLVYDLKKKKSYTIDIGKNFIKVNEAMKSTVWFFGYKIQEKKLILYPSNTNKILIIDIESKEIQRKSTGMISKKEIVDLYLSDKSADRLYESEIVNLNDWIFAIERRCESEI